MCPTYTIRFPLRDLLMFCFGLGTFACSDPTHDFIGILLMQRLMDSLEPPAVFKDFSTLAYRSLEA